MENEFWFCRELFWMIQNLLGWVVYFVQFFFWSPADNQIIHYLLLDCPMNDDDWYRLLARTVYKQHNNGTILIGSVTWRRRRGPRRNEKAEWRLSGGNKHVFLISYARKSFIFYVLLATVLQSKSFALIIELKKLKCLLSNINSSLIHLYIYSSKSIVLVFSHFFYKSFPLCRY